MMEVLAVHEDKLADMDQQTAADLAELFRAMSDPSRLRILAALLEAELNVGAIAAQVDMSESAVSHHLRGLRQMRLVRADKQGREVYYQLDDDHVVELFKLGLEHVQHG
ncbi:MAG: winged helix-turn-helix transcriptional regulator [Caldilineaceae bacterium]|nr:winged helix-turn-helix transcriptional regulator [Caldilineaceae bacterium]MCB0142342.1 winged helix-turn-helix transcriptional regulator [Caldilineaceae bacterium]